MAKLNVINITIVVTLVVVASFTFSACKSRSVKNADFFIPEGFEGPVVLLTGVRSDNSSRIVDSTLIIDVPVNGIVLLDIQADQYGRLKRNFYTQDGIQIPYLHTRRDDAREGEAYFESLSERERSAKKFVMRHSKGSFENRNGQQQFYSFVVGFPEKVNLYAGSELPGKVEDARALSSLLREEE